MGSLTQSYSFSSNIDSFSSSQWEQNTRFDATDGVRRVTVRQLLKATTSGDLKNQFQLDGVDVKQVIIVANICDERETLAGKSYDFDDGTGRIRGTGRVKNPGSNFVQFAYVRVVGQLEQYRGLNNLKVINIQQLFEPHEVYFHMLHAIYETLKLEGRPAPLNLSCESHKEIPTTPNSPVDSLSQSFEHVSLSSEVGQPPTPQDIFRRPRLRSQLERDIVSFILENTDDDSDTTGVSIVNIVDHIKATHPTADALATSNAIEYLLTEDFIETAGDELHYKPGGRFISRN